MAALQYVDVPGYSAAIFRLTEEDYKKPDSVRNRAEQWFAGTPARWSNDVDGFVFPSGATLHFGTGHNGNIDALRRAYQGVPFQAILVDELTQWNEEAYRFLFSRLVRLVTQRQVPIRMRASSNPDGPGSDWVRKRFVDGAVHITTGMSVKTDLMGRRQGGTPLPKPRVYRSPPSDEAVDLARELGHEPQGAYFVPSFVADNPGVDVATYRVQLAKLDPVSREQLEHGDWWVFSGGGFFKPENFKILDVEPQGVDWIRAWDLAGTKPDPKRKNDPAWTAGVKLGIWRYDEKRPERQRLVIAHVEHFRDDPGPTQARVSARIDLDGRSLRQIIEQEPGSAGKMVIANFQAGLFGYELIGMPKTGPKEEYWRPVSAIANANGLYLVRAEWNETLVSQLTKLPNGKKDIADAIATGTAWLLDGGADVARIEALVNVPW